MWNKAAQKSWKEADQDFIAEKPSIASSSEFPGNYLSAKRQRRPSVRLEDIGDRPAAISAEKKRKKIVFFASPTDACPGKRTLKLKADEPLENTSTVLKVRPLVRVNTGNTNGHDSSHDYGELERQTVRYTELTSPCSRAPAECWQQEPQAALGYVTERPTPSRFLKSVSMKGSNGTARCRGPKVTASVKQFASAELSVTTEREPHIKDTIDAHLEEENEACTPEGFRDCDLETSDYFNDPKDLSNSMESKPSKNGDMSPLLGEQECQLGGAYENGSTRQDHDFAKRDKDPLSQQVSERGLMKSNEQSREKSKEEEASTGVWTETADKTQALVEDSQGLTEAHRAPHAIKVKSKEIQKPPSNNTNLRLAKYDTPLLNGVRGWLQNLGLGKYTQQFEAHEVDLEVLPLLTFDDLKEMGITAVGSRRKLYSAIQQLGKCLFVKAD